MLNYLLPSRRRAEAARVARFVHAIKLSERYAVNPDWNLQPVPDTDAGRTDTVAFPRIVLAGTIITAAAVLGACTSGANTPAQTTARPTLDQPVYLGPGQAAADRQLLDAVDDIAPWLRAR